MKGSLVKRLMKKSFYKRKMLRDAHTPVKFMSAQSLPPISEDCDVGSSTSHIFHNPLSDTMWQCQPII